MRIERLRPAHTPEKLAELYAEPHDSSKGIGHDVRIEATYTLAEMIVDEEERRSVADLSCGKRAHLARFLGEWRHLGDVAVLPAGLRADAKYHGPIEETVGLIPNVDLFICTETLEHLDVPVDVLRQIRAKARRLLLSTPVNNWRDATDNEEHYWAWDREAVEVLIRDAGWEVEAYMELDLRPIGGWYEFGMWVLR